MDDLIPTVIVYHLTEEMDSMRCGRGFLMLDRKKKKAMRT
jgi:hypothetical protein